MFTRLNSKFSEANAPATKCSASRGYPKKKSMQDFHPKGPNILSRVLSPHHPDVLRSFRRRSPADSAVGSSAPPGSHAAPPAPAPQETLAPSRERVRVRGNLVAEIIGTSNYS